VQLLRGLSEAVLELERAHCAHRDLSSGNVFIEMNTWRCRLIDWDSAYHPTLTMPANTTCGTSGYVAPFVWTRGQVDTRLTWHPRADRCAMAFLNAEFLTLGPGSPMTEEGGMYKQDETCRRSGPGLESSMKTLKQGFPEAAVLFQRALRAGSYDECPSPAEWCECCRRVPPPALNQVPELPPAFFEEILARRRPAAPIWAAPRLADVALELPVLPLPNRQVPHLPADPWKQ